jgi:plasmid stabilization system protein ParE
MKYHVVFELSGARDLDKSYEWGCQKWGKAQARKWHSEIVKAIKTLAEFPERQPIAPENDEFDEEIRQMVYGRYRVLFTIRGNKVAVLHCRGGYTGKDLH